MDALPLYHRLAGAKVILLAEGEAGAAKRRLLLRAGAIPVNEDDPEARLAFIALDAPDDAARRLGARGLLLNVTDRPDLCDFTVPSILERGPVVIAVGTGGVSAGLAKAIRMRLETLLPHSVGRLAMALGAARQRLRQRWPDPIERRQQIDRALAAGGTLDPLRDFDSGQLETWLEQSSGADQTKSSISLTEVEVVLISDDPDDLSLRDARCLAQADLVVHDPGVAPAILALARADASRCLSGEERPAIPLRLIVTLRQG